MKKLMLAVLGSFLLLWAEPTLAAPPDSEYQLVLQDEFEGEVLNTELWGYRCGSNYGGKNSRENVRVEDGKLLLDFKKNGNDYTGGGVLTNFTLPYGYYEVKAKVFGKTAAVHSSFWLSGAAAFDEMPEKQPLNNTIIELDGFEIDSHNSASLSCGTIYWWAKNDSKYTHRVTTKDFSEEWFVAGIEWLPDQVNYYIDGELVRTDTELNAYSPSYVYLTALAMPSVYGDKIDPAIADENGYFGSTEFEYFRYYQKPLKNINLLGNGDFEYDRIANQLHCYVADADTVISQKSASAYDGIQFARQTENAKIGQIFNKLLPGSYTFSGFFRGMDGNCKASLVAEDKSGTVICKKEILLSENWQKTEIKDIYIQDYAYVYVEGNASFDMDNLEFYCQSGTEFAMNTADYHQYDSFVIDELDGFSERGIYGFSDANETSGTWNASGAYKGSYYSSAVGSPYVKWTINAEESTDYIFEVHRVAGSDNVKKQYYTVYVNDVFYNEYAVDTINIENGWLYVDKIPLKAGDSVTIQLNEKAYYGDFRVSNIRLSEALVYEMNTIVAMQEGSCFFIGSGKLNLFKSTDKSLVPYTENGVHYIPYQALAEKTGIVLDTAADAKYITNLQLEESGKYKFFTNNGIWFVVKNDAFLNANTTALSQLVFSKYQTYLKNAVQLSQTTENFDSRDSFLFSFTDAFKEGVWHSSAIGGGSNYSYDVDASVLWSGEINVDGKIECSIFIPCHESSTQLASVSCLIGNSYKEYRISISSSQSAWYTLGTFDAKKGESVVIRLSNPLKQGTLRAADVKYTFIVDEEPLFLGTDAETTAIVMKYEDAVKTGIWARSSLWNGSYYSSNQDASIKYTNVVPNKGKYSIQIFSPSQIETTEYAKVLVYVNGELCNVAKIDQKTGAGGWYEICVRDLEKDDVVEIEMFKKGGNFYLRAADARVVPLPQSVSVQQSDGELKVDMGYLYKYCGAVLYAEYTADKQLEYVEFYNPKSTIDIKKNNTENGFKLFFWESASSMRPVLPSVERLW